MLTDAWRWRQEHPRGYEDRVPPVAERPTATEGHERNVAASIAIG